MAAAQGTMTIEQLLARAHARPTLPMTPPAERRHDLGSA